MGRRRYSNIVGAIATTAILLIGIEVAKAQPQGGKGAHSRRMSPPRHAPNLNNPRDRWIAMPPEDRQIFRRNAERWMQMGPEERKVLREREKVYRQRVKVEVDSTLRDSGLRLEGEKRDQFEQRYLQERRRIEHELRQETEAKRQEQLPALRERLKKEFQEPLPSTTSAPAGSSSPKK
ncbi:MAG TPA: DUF3106 domain-containing protein [Chthoniobacterales bacterium]|nr:DUF3106 domain-containing protein [Chthoniobacterales bacterium]